MNNASGVLTRQGLKRDLRQICGTGRWILPLIGVALLLLSVPLTHAQTTAQLTGTVQDRLGGVIPGAQVTLTDEATGVMRVVETNGQGLYAFPCYGAWHLHGEGHRERLPAQGNYWNRWCTPGTQLAIPAFTLDGGL